MQMTAMKMLGGRLSFQGELRYLSELADRLRANKRSRFLLTASAAAAAGRRQVAGDGRSRPCDVIFRIRDQPSAVICTVVPARTFANIFTSDSAVAKTLHGLARRVSSPWEIGVRPKPMAIARPSGQ
jgi:hypothetical protein